MSEAITKRGLTPIQIEVLIHYYCACQDVEMIHPYTEAIAGLMNHKLLEFSAKHSGRGAFQYVITPRGQEHVLKLCKVDLPVTQLTEMSPSKLKVLRERKINVRS
jgi:hypothetical protein